MPKDTQFGKPSLLPGDIVKDKATGTIMVIIEARAIINGSAVHWNEELPKVIEHSWNSCYSTQTLPKYKNNLRKAAWWDLDELELVEYGILHKYLRLVLSNY